METYSYNVGELRQLIREKSEFNAVKGANVDSENKSNNDKSYKESEKRAKDYDGGLKDKKKPALGKKTDGNRTTLDANPTIPASKEYQEKVDAQSQGYTSTLEAKNGNERGGCEMDDDKRILKQFTDARDEHEKNKKAIQKSGLTAQHLDDKVFDKNHLTVNENKAPKAKKLIFKHSKFINESQVLARIPEEYKRDGQKIFVNDAAGNEFIIECTKSVRSGMIETHITGHKNEKLMNEQVSRIHELMGYNSNEVFGNASVQDKINESESFQGLMDLARGVKNC